MRKIAPLLLFLSLLLLVVQSLSAQTRPRRVGQSGKSAPPVTPQPPTNTRPPVLGGATTSNGQQRPQSTSTRPTNEPEEVGDGDVVSVNTTLVTVPLSVMDRDGKYIPNLRKEDFRLYEEGVEQPIAYFSSVEKPFTVALMIDTSGSTHFKIEEMQDAAIAFVNQLRADDRVMVISFDDSIKVLAEPTSDRYAVRNAIRRTRTGGGTRLYDAVEIVMKQHLRRVNGRKAVVLFTDGVDTTSKRATYESTVRDAEELDALVYPVQFDTYEDVNARGGGGGPSWPMPRRRSSVILNWPFPFPLPIPGGGTVGGRGGGGGGSSREAYRRANDYLRDLADKTGARVYPANTTYNLERAFAQVAEELRRQYSIGYYPQNAAAQAGQRRQIKVRVNQPNLVVRARDSYISGATSNASAQGTQGQPAPPVLKRKFTNYGLVQPTP